MHFYFRAEDRRGNINCWYRRLFHHDKDSLLSFFWVVVLTFTWTSALSVFVLSVAHFGERHCNDVHFPTSTLVFLMTEKNAMRVCEKYEQKMQHKEVFQDFFCAIKRQTYDWCHRPFILGKHLPEYQCVTRHISWNNDNPWSFSESYFLDRNLVYTNEVQKSTTCAPWHGKI